MPRPGWMVPAKYMRCFSCVHVIFNNALSGTGSKPVPLSRGKSIGCTAAGLIRLQYIQCAYQLLHAAITRRQPTNPNTPILSIPSLTFAHLLLRTYYGSSWHIRLSYKCMSLKASSGSSSIASIGGGLVLLFEYGHLTSMA